MRSICAIRKATPVVAAIVAMLSMSVLFVGTTVAQSKEKSDAAEKAGPVFEDGQAQIVEAFSNRDEWVKHDLWVETSFDSDWDGEKDRMHVSVCRPKQTETEGLKVPVIYSTSPYFAGIGSTTKQFMWTPEVELGVEPPKHETPPEIKQRKLRPQISTRFTGTWVPRGFAVVHSCSPGTGLSQGCPSCGADNEALAPKAVIDWLNGRAKGYTSPDGVEEVKADWCTGKVGMTGTSYNGTLPVAAATTGVEGLEAIIPDAPNTSYYHYYRANGLVRHPGGYMGEDIDVLYNFIHSGDPKNREKCNERIRDKEMAENQDRDTGDYNEFWAGRDYLNDMDNFKAATLLSHGFNDWNVMPSHSIRVYEECKRRGIPCQLYMHQGGHGGPPPLPQMNRWFTRYLYGIENDVENDPRAFIVRENDSRKEPTSYADYPNPEAKPVTLHLGKGGLELGALALDKMNDAQGTETLIDNAEIRGSTLARAEGSPHRLLFATPELTAPVHLSGTSTITIKLACDKPAANLSVWMVSLPWKRTPKLNENLITRGWADPQNHKSLTESEPLEPGKFYELSFTLEPDDQIIPVGQQIGLMIFSSDRDFTLWPKKGTELTVDLDGTTITIPVVGGRESLEAATMK
ncbi:MAG: Xaa-Pro dipeptidyl-peptidase [Planctomycetota bacterium]